MSVWLAKGLRPILASTAGLALLASLVSAAEARGPATRVNVDPFTLETRAIPSRQIELVTLSSPPTAVSGGDVLVGVRGLRHGDRLVVTRNGRRVTRSFDRRIRRGERRGLVRGLRRGRNTIVAIVRRGRGRSERRMRAAMTVTNHPVTGPIISGPHQQPFFCETERSGLGAPVDEHCSIEPRFQWFYRSAIDQEYKELGDPFAPYPDDVMRTRTEDRKTVPFVVRLETRTINRGITRIAVLDDPHARGRDGDFEPNWNGRVTYAFGESCGVGYRQGSSSPEAALGGIPSAIGADSIFATIYGIADRVGRGDVIAHSTQTTFGVYCNPLTSAESLMMIKEHISKRYGIPERTVGVGGSGGALQQYNAVNNYPGLIDAAIPVATFTDIPSTAMTTVDCGLFLEYWERTGMSWSDRQKAEVAGHRTSQICRSWRETFLNRLDPQEGCDSPVPRAARYHPENNPTGARCTLQDATINVWGRDPETGFARRPYDNVGVQYGLGALNRGEISVEQFLDLNRSVGGYDMDARWIPQRNEMDAESARKTYRLGGVVGRGQMHRTPIIDLASYLDLIPIADIHDVIRPFQVRDRLRARSAMRSTGSMAIWRGLTVPPDARIAMDRWLDRIGSPTPGGRARRVASARPPAAADYCAVAAVGSRVDIPDSIVLPFGIQVTLLPGLVGEEPLFSFPVGAFVSERQEVGQGLCDRIFPARSAPRIVAGGPLSDDVIKCSLKPVDPADYQAPLSPDQLEELRRIFPGGVCDWSKPGVGEVERSMNWPTIGGTRLREPTSLRWRAIRSPVRRGR